jgi:hypothetical protein
MENRSRLSGINTLEWFLIGFLFLMVGAAGYALGTQATLVNNQSLDSKRFHENVKKLKLQQKQVNQPLHAQPSDLQGGSQQTQQKDVSNPQGNSLAPEEDIIYPYDPGPCGPYERRTERVCLGY